MSERTDGYAAAILEFATAEGELNRVESELHSIAAAIESNSELRSALTDPAVPAARKQSVIDDLVEGRVSRVTSNLVALIAAQNRMGELGEIARKVSERKAASAGARVAEVRSAVPLDEATVQRLAAALAKQVGAAVEVRTVVDPNIMGGIVARIGDTVIDGSVRSRLQSLRQTLQNT
ncbi:MAG: ATP synthase F1 subunit delta [Acidimicrobiia bacterium]|nr:ATP synthase F1 subunit delta [Acidimicrobiia bacterium]